MQTAAERTIVTVDDDGHFVFPSEIQSAFQPGARWQVFREDSRLILQPAVADPITALRGMFAGQPSLEDDLMEWRREEEAHRVRKEKEWG